MKQIKSSALVISIILSLGIQASQMLRPTGHGCQQHHFGNQVKTVMKNRVATRDGSGPIIGHTGKYFAITDGDRSCRVTSDCMDNTVKHLNSNNLCKFLEKGSLKATKMSDGNYMLRAHVDGKGGGVLGFWAGYFSGKALTHFVCHGILLGVSSLAGPAAPAAFAALEATFMLPISVGANTVGATTGMALAVATGPV
jgi:hypothetical protein